MARPLKIAVLGRSGDARNQLRDALAGAGGEVVVEGDPLDLGPERVSADPLDVVILSLEPETDEAVLERWDSLLQRPGLNVIFDEAAASAHLAGWDQSRWARHLAAKALGVDVLLPPRPEGGTREIGLASTARPRSSAAPTLRADPATVVSVRPAATVVANAALMAGVARIEEAANDRSHPPEQPSPIAEAAAPDRPRALDFDSPTIDSIDRVEVDETRNDDLEFEYDDSIALSIEIETDLGATGIEDMPFDAALAALDGLDLDQAAPAGSIPTDTVDDRSSAEIGGFDFSLADFDSPLSDSTPARSTLPASDEPDDVPIFSLDESGDPLSEDLSGLLASLDARLESDASGSSAGHAESDPLAALLATPQTPEHDDHGSTVGATPATASDSGFSDDDPPIFATEEGDDFTLAWESVPIAAAAKPSAPEPPASAKASSERPKFDFSSLSLEPVDDEPSPPAARAESPASAPTAAAPAAPAVTPPTASVHPSGAEAPAVPPVASPARPKFDISKLAAGFGLLPETTPDSNLATDSDAPQDEIALTDAAADSRMVSGAVVLVAGVGGPDAIRRFLTALDRRLPVPMLVRQQLAAANHDRLALQLAKVSAEPVSLARVGESARHGEAHLLPEGLSARLVADGGIELAEGRSHDLIEHLGELAENLVVLLLSGADAAVVGQALAVEKRGARVYAQNPEECVESTAAARAQKEGVRTGSPEHLAFWVKEHWRV